MCFTLGLDGFFFLISYFKTLRVIIGRHLETVLIILRKTVGAYLLQLSLIECIHGHACLRDVEFLCKCRRSDDGCTYTSYQ